jgi:hypothetical protein
MRRFAGVLSLAAAMAVGGLMSAVAFGADDEHKVDCAETGMKFEAPGYEVTCEDHSDTAGAGEVTVGVKIFVLHAMSEKDVTFLDVIDDHIVGHTGVFYHRTSLQSDIDRYFKGSFSNWADQEEIDGFDVKRFSAVFGNDKEPLDCIAFRREGARRYEGIAGKTVGIACSMQGRDYAVNALKQFNKD